MSLKHTSEIALRALLAGQTVELPGYSLPIKLAKPGDELNFPSACGEALDYALVYCLPDGHHLGCELDLSDFIRGCDKLSEEGRIHLVASLTLADQIKPRSPLATIPQADA